MTTLFTKEAPTQTGEQQSLPSTPMNVFSAFATHPKRLRFETQENDEVIVLFLRQHLITLLPWIVIGVLLVVAPTILFPVLYKALATVVSIPTGYIIVGTIFWYVGTFGLLLSKFMHWFFNIFIVTDERIVDIDFINLLHKDVAETRLSRVQDISYSTNGIFAALFNYGNVSIQTAGEQPNFSFECVPKPNKVVDIISDTAKLFVKNH